MPDTEHTAAELRAAAIRVCDIQEQHFELPKDVWIERELLRVCGELRRLASGPCKEERFADLVKGCLREYKSTDADCVTALAGIMTFESIVLSGRPLKAAQGKEETDAE